MSKKNMEKISTCENIENIDGYKNKAICCRTILFLSYGNISILVRWLHLLPALLFTLKREREREREMDLPRNPQRTGYNPLCS